MRLLILTRPGLDDALANIALPGATLFVNPDLLLPEEIARLRHAGAEIRLLPSAVDPASAPGVQSAIRHVEEQAGGPIWLEHPFRSSQSSGLPTAAGQSTDPQPASPDNSSTDLAHQALHRRLFKTAGALAGQALRQITKNIGPARQMTIVPYLGYGNMHRISVRGRLLEDEGFNPQTRDDSRWSNLVHLYKRLESDEVAGARIRARFGGVIQEAVTDGGGYFSFDIVPVPALAGSGWHKIELELTHPRAANGVPVRATAEALVPPSTARFGVISDIDDTVLWTNVTNKLNMLRMLARSNAHTRKPFKGVAAFYRALRDGAGGNENNPVFYVSSSPWHLFTPLVEFLRLQDIPVGPLMLKELDVRKLFGPGRHKVHKLEKIEHILRFYPDLPFVLIGDSGEQDPEIYAEIVKRHPQQVRVIYIRNVNPDPARIDAIDRLIDEVRSTGAQLILAPDSVSAAAHAASESLIRVDGMANVRVETRKDEAAGTPA